MISSTSLHSQAIYTRSNLVKIDIAATSEAGATGTTQATPNTFRASTTAVEKRSATKPDWSYYTSYNNVDHSEEDYRRVKTEGGRLLSQSQGLPEGHYDFSRMNRDEMNIALNDIIINRRASQDVIDGLTQLANTTYDKPVNQLDVAGGSIEYENSQKNMFVVGILKAALTYMQADKALFETLKPKELTTQEALSNRSLAAQSGN